jgi:Fic family protein
MNPKDFISQSAGKVTLTPSGYYTFIPNPLPPFIEWNNNLVSVLAEAERNLSKLTTQVNSSLFPNLLARPFIHHEAVISSRIEGTKASLEDLFTYETGQLPLWEESNDVREVFNYVQALDIGMERVNTLPVSMRLIREIHEKLTYNVRGGTLTPGEFRRSQNWIGPMGSTLANAPYVPLPVEEMQTALNDLEKFIHQENRIPPLVRAGMIHYQFEAIHPFLDGNGRVGRLLIILLLCEWGLLNYPILNLSSYIDHYRQEYYDKLLAVSQRGDWEEWLLFFLRGIRETAAENLVRISTLQIIHDKYQEIAKKERNEKRMVAIVDFIFEHPLFTIRQLVEDLAMPYKTAIDYVRKLENAGFIHEKTGQARNRLYQSDEILIAIETKR